MSRVREARAAIAEASLQEVTSGAGPIIGGGMGIAILENPKDVFVEAAFETVELFEERDESRGMLHGARLIEPLGDVSGSGGANLGSDGSGTGHDDSLLRGLGFGLGFFVSSCAERH